MSHLDQLPPAARHIGREIVRIDPDGVAHLRFLAQPEFVNRHGTVQGGFLSAMLDSATMTPLLAQLPEDRVAVTAKLEVEFLRPAPLGPFTARAWLMTKDDRVATTRGELSDPNGNVVAAATATLRILPRKR